jgi:hypothetical protein
VVRAIQAVLIAGILAAIVLLGLLLLRATPGPVSYGGDGDCFRDSSSTMTCVMP